MSDNQHPADTPEDVVESIVPYMPYVLPIGGGILIFLLAFIAVFMGCPPQSLPCSQRQPLGAFFIAFAQTLAAGVCAESIEA